MEELIAELKALAARHATSPNPDVQSILGGLNTILERAEVTPAAYQYRHHLGWDNTWLDLDENQVTLVLKNGHTVERRRIAGDWEAVTEAPSVSD
ncbi:hypothetical protein [Pseudarthrobacter chlorophenolicus]|nr:hypothetical protein [Pseudarthrobacter chlorophenolicus]